jgi:hypothetical protein
MLAADLCHRQSGFTLAQDRHDLALREFRLPHRSFPQSSGSLYFLVVYRSGESTLALLHSDPLATWISGIPLLGPYAKSMALAITVVVRFGSSTAILSILGARRKEEPPVTNDEIKVLM